MPWHRENVQYTSFVAFCVIVGDLYGKNSVFEHNHLIIRQI